MQLFTIQVGKWRLARNRDILMFDTTVKSGNDMVSPTWTLVMGHKHGTMSDEEYTAQYRQMLVDSWMKEREKWMKFLQDDSPMALACYCKHGHFCHRYLLVEFLERLCKQLKIKFEYYGELTD